ncbi:MAG TPA: hypothetical protein VH764_04415 [Gemmatimonadales bacterium]|jgi:hypothetical protein
MRILPCCLALAVVASPLHAQALEDKITDLFIFGEGGQVLFLGGSGSSDNPTIQVHGMHFIPSAVSTNGTIISFLTSAVGSNVANLPVSASSGGETFQFEGGTPVRTSISSGPIYAERAQTLGSGRLYLSLSRTGLTYETLRGVPLDQMPLVFTHANVDFPGCDAIAGGDCTSYGIPVVENEVIDFNLNLGVTVDVTAFALTYGITDRIDLGVVLPVVKTSLQGSSEATIIPFASGGTPPHFFAGTEENPILTASRSVEGSSSGIGDVSARMKFYLRAGTPVSLGVLAEGRFPTGSEEDLRGSGAVALRGLGIISARLGNFSPHANLGYQYRGREEDPDVFLATAGFDHLLAPWATLAADLISEFPVTDSPIEVPGDVTLEEPFRRTVHTSSIPDRRDDIINASLGVKLTIPRAVTVVANSAFPLNRGGMRPDVLWTFGVEYTF